MASFKCVLRLFVVILLVFYNESASQEFCLTPNKEDAQCVSLESCPVIFNGVKMFNSTVIDFAKKSRCAAEGKRNGVCCGTLNYLKAISCVTPSQENGECVRVEECAPIFEGLQHLDDAAIELAKKSRCNTEEPQEGTDLYVCCGPSPLPPVDRMGTVIHEPSSPSATKKPHANKVSDRSYCGYQHTDDYFRTSEDTSIDEFPWVALMVHSNDTGNEQQHCLGALINSRYVVTTAICVNKTDAEEGFTITSVRLGGYRVNSTVDCVPFQEDDAECSDAVTVGVEKIILHPDFSNGAGSPSEAHFNIALLRLAKAIAYSDYIRPICLPDSDFKADVGSNVSFTGWGEHDIKLAIKEKRRGIIVSMQECINVAKDWPKGILTEEHLLCFKEKDTKPCVSATGGLLTVHKRFQWQIEGVLVFPIKENCEESPLAAYTNVAKHITWIIASIKP